MFERFTDRARRVLVLAQDEARALEHDFLGTEHILLGMLAEGEGVASKALTELGFELDAVRERVLGVIPRGAPGTASGAPPFTPRAKKVLELSLREALELTHNYIGTEHLLLGLIREGEGVAAQVLTAAGVEAVAVRSKVLTLLAGHQPAAVLGRTTPAGGQIAVRAKAVAGTDPIGTQHFLLALLEDRASLAARVLDSLGVTKEAVTTRIAEIGPTGTTDEMPDRRPAAKPFKFDFGGATLEVADDQLAVRLAVALQQAKEAGTGTGAVAEDLAKIVVELLLPKPPAPPGEDEAKPAPE